MKDKNQVHTRSLHAEENAFLQAAKRGSTGIGGGVLYTTASPCELCSKKAYQLGIKDIVYVDPYPGISTTHILRSGNAESRPQLRLFSGSVGSAYHRLYEPLLSIKDELDARMGNTPIPQEVIPAVEADDG
jgi:deoxycytidylate deaminase